VLPRARNQKLSDPGSATLPLRAGLRQQGVGILFFFFSQDFILGYSLFTPPPAFLEEEQADFRDVHGPFGAKDIVPF